MKHTRTHRHKNTHQEQKKCWKCLQCGAIGFPFLEHVVFEGEKRGFLAAVSHLTCWTSRRETDAMNYSSSVISSVKMNRTDI